jgi:glucose-6-phosphate 1-dehydrogenase
MSAAAGHDPGPEHSGDTRGRPGPTILVIVGAGGDLAARKLYPALYNLYVDGWLPERFAAVGMDRAPMEDAAFQRHARDGVERFSRRPPDAARWAALASALTHLHGDLGAPAATKALGAALAAIERRWGAPAQRIFYLATPPAAVGPAVRSLGAAGLADGARLVVEKPFGHDLESARALTREIGRVFAEPRIFRIDHYLGKETVQNILALRFGNALYEPVWNRRYIDNVQVTVAETVGVEHRGAYYEGAGALRDMVQNHLLQLLCLVAMEPPVSFDADEVRNKKVDVLRAVRPMAPGDAADAAVRGQYGPGTVDGTPVAGYRAEPGVAPASATETFAALRLYVDNWRWQGVPFYLRTGKRLPAKATEVAIQFQPAPHLPFPVATLGHWQPNRLVVLIQPDEGVVVRFQAKRPGPVMHLDAANMRFDYRRAFGGEPPEAYETLLLDVMWGDATLFMRADQIEAAWSIVQPVLDAWQAAPPDGIPTYPAGAWGPAAAESLPARDGRAWVPPSITEEGPHGS